MPGTTRKEFLRLVKEFLQKRGLTGLEDAEWWDSSDDAPAVLFTYKGEEFILGVLEEE